MSALKVPLASIRPQSAPRLKTLPVSHAFLSVGVEGEVGGEVTGELGAGERSARDGDDDARADGGGADVEGRAEGAVEGVEEGEFRGGGGFRGARGLGAAGEGAGGGEEEDGEGEAHFGGDGG